MVNLGKEEEIVCERSRVLHNFKMPWLKWGCRKVMKCMKDDNLKREVSATARGYRRSCDLIGRLGEIESDQRRGLTDRRRVTFRFSPEKERLGFGDGIEAVREKMMFDFSEVEQRRRTEVEVCESMKPWNLRTRRARLDPEVIGIEGGVDGISKSKPKPKSSCSPVRNEEVKVKSPCCLRGGGGGVVVGEKRERAKFSISLSKEEIAEDFLAITGHRMNRRPKKRPKTVQKRLDMLFPGLWLTEVNADMYKVPDVV